MSHLHLEDKRPNLQFTLSLRFRTGIKTKKVSHHSGENPNPTRLQGLLKGVCLKPS